ncbi:MAG: type I secretion system permease/ATPase [Hydrogenophilales bacterium CG_4_10_14_3_um_filter_58_23]|nr:MAG: type I secretion system permease/ATPase [Hydrogenophilales bacterium CG_4_10_14_3_um_filter_58_23]
MKNLLNPQREIDKILLGFRQAFLRVGAFSFVINLLMLMPAIYMLQIYDRVLVSRSSTTLFMLTAIVLVLFILMSILEFVRSGILVRVGNQLDVALSSRIFTAAFERNLQRQGGNPAQALSDLTAVRQFLTGAGIFAFFDTPWIPIFIIVASLLHPLIGLFCLFGGIILFALAWLNEMVTRKPLAEATTHAIAAGQYANNNLRNAEVIEAMGMLGNLRQRWQERQQKFLALQSLASERAGVISAVSRFTRITLQSLVLGLGAWLALDDTITGGAMIAGSILMGRALAPVDQVIAVWKQLIAARAAYQRLNEMLSAFPVGADQLPLPAPHGEVTIENVTAAPPGSKHVVLKNIAIRINRGDVVGVMGASAAGKSSLARLLVGVWRPHAGNVRLDGADIARWNKELLGSYIGYLPQDVELFEGTIAENIARFGELDSNAIVAAAQMAGVHDMILRLEQGYDTPIGIDGSSLSGGQKQRIGLARALYGSPVLIVLDEPNSNLDEIGEAALAQAILQAKAKGSTVIVITHRPGTLSVVDKILILREGSLAAYGPRDEVLAALRQPAPALTVQTPEKG